VKVSFLCVFRAPLQVPMQLQSNIVLSAQVKILFTWREVSIIGNLTVCNEEGRYNWKILVRVNRIMQLCGIRINIGL
jgi:hypothetical protein